MTPGVPVSPPAGAGRGRAGALGMGPASRGRAVPRRAALRGREFNDLGDRDKGLPVPPTGSCSVSVLGQARVNFFLFHLNNSIYSIISNRSHLPAVC